MPDTPPKTVQWIGDAATGHLRLIEQTLLPERLEYVDCRDVESVWQAIKRLAVRGAPAIGVAAAYGCVIGAQAGAFKSSADYLATSRPTAVNLFWAIDRMKALGTGDPEALLGEARAIHAEDTAMCRAIGEHGAGLIASGDAVLTHCNAGALATAGIGTATAPMYVAHEAGVAFKVYADETRPLLQGARLTAWELSRAGIDVTVLCDNMAAVLMRDGGVTRVITGADRIAANGDVANKIGTYGLAVMARHHGVPFHIAAPSSTFDLATATGAEIPIEQRDPAEVARGFGPRTAPEGAAVYNPAFDVTPHALIASIITERGTIEPVNRESVAALMSAHG
ncbi:MAG: S-methyl-5-thioribose-1-phosphate isomerase [Planctomycetota bacterium]|jgi:methylthioribose-1-phosphate isomerase